MSVTFQTERLADIDAEGKPVMYVEGSYEAGDVLPTEGIYQGSWLLNITDKETVKFFNGDTGAWV